MQKIVHVRFGYEFDFPQTNRKPNNNPLAGVFLEIMLSSANAYARILQCKEIWICEPINEDLVFQYQKRGYTPVQDRFGVTTHLTMKVNYE